MLRVRRGDVSLHHLPTKASEVPRLHRQVSRLQDEARRLPKENRAITQHIRLYQVHAEMRAEVHVRRQGTRARGLSLRIRGLMVPVSREGQESMRRWNGEDGSEIATRHRIALSFLAAERSQSSRIGKYASRIRDFRERSGRGPRTRRGRVKSLGLEGGAAETRNGVGHSVKGVVLLPCRSW